MLCHVAMCGQNPFVREMSLRVVMCAFECGLWAACMWCCGGAAAALLGARVWRGASVGARAGA